MLQTLLDELEKEITFSKPVKWDTEKKCHLFLFDDAEILLEERKEHLFIQSVICAKPANKKEEVFIRLMEANLLGLGTGGSVISLDKQEKFLTLSLDLPYEMNYPAFKENLEDFTNYLFYWREEIEKLLKASLL